MTDENVQAITELIKLSDLDETIKNILIRDLEKEGLTDFLKEQIKAYCIEGMKKHGEAIRKARQALGEDPTTATPA